VKKENPSAYNFQFSGNEDSIRSYQIHLASIFNPGQRVLDLGCGNGYFLDLLKDRGVFGEGVDLNSSCVEACRSKGHLVVQAEAIDFLQRNDESYDAILSSHLIEHLNPESAKLLIELSVKLLKPNGTLLIITPNPIDIKVITETFWLDPTHVRPYPGQLIASWMHGSGLGKIQVTVAKGTKLTRPSFRLPMQVLSYFKYKLIFGRHANTGDTLVIGTKF
jgi:2-polyprenyl-3-methyl-5-hydroxy-6-metoxy-1,4-benzoquinol methylase